AVTLSLAEPLTAALLGIAVLGERPTVTELLGIALLLAGLVVLAEVKPSWPRAWSPGGSWSKRAPSP
ncbi:MAG: hypothetical protein DIU84_09520, partial [Bacillota bacterium]